MADWQIWDERMKGFQDRLRRVGIDPDDPSKLEDLIAIGNIIAEVTQPHIAEQVDTVLRMGIVQRYLDEEEAATRRGEVWRMSQPWHALADKYLNMLLAAEQVFRFPTVPYPGVTSGLNYYLASILWMAKPYFWRSETSSLVENMAVPRHRVSRQQMPYPAMFLSFDTARTIRAGGSNSTQTWRSNWLLVIDMMTQMGIFGDLRPEDSPTNGEEHIDVVTANVPYDNLYPDDFESQSVEAVRNLLASLAFINSPYVVKEENIAPRYIRRLAEKGGGWSPTSADYSVITLRRKVPAQEAAAPGDSGGREWNYRWTVSGHIRNQWYPSSNTHRLLWIDSYTKGPEGLPLKETVYDVKR